MTTNTITWQNLLAAGEQARFGYRLNLPDSSDDYFTETELAYNINGFFRPYGRYQLVLTVEYSHEELLSKSWTISQQPGN